MAQVITDAYALYHGDCIDVMRALPDASVRLSVYSPPFGGLYIGQPDKAKAALDAGHTRYAPSMGLPDFRARLAKLKHQAARLAQN